MSEPVVKQDDELQEDVPSETQQMDVGPLELLLPEDLESALYDLIKEEIDIGPTMLYKPLVNEPTEEEVTQPDGTQSCGDYINTENKSTKSTVSYTELSEKSILKKHKEKKTFSCSKCHYKGAQKAHLIRHMNTHTGEKPHSDYNKEIKSTESTVSYTELSDKSVLKKHKEKRPFSCSKCDYKGAQKAHLIRHMNTHTGEKPYSCVCCQYKCSEKRDLVKHMFTHTGEKPYSCNNCKYTCSLKQSLLRHMRTHTGEKPYSCTNCKYKCSEKQSLVRHMRTHTGEKPYSCSDCQYKSSERRNLVRHVHMYSHRKKI